MSDSLRNTVSIYLVYGNGSLSLLETCFTGSDSGTDSIALNDFNNDSYMDIVISLGIVNSVGLLKGYGNGRFACEINYLTENEFILPSFALSDFNHDGQVDIAVSSAYRGYVQIFLGSTNGTFSKSKRYFIGLELLYIKIIVDYFNDDDHVDIAVLCGANSFLILFATEDGDFLKGRLHVIPSNGGSNTMVSSHLNNDSRTDLVISNWFDNKLYIYLGNGSEPFGMANLLPTGYESQPHCSVSSHFNDDNRSDIVVANYGTDNIAIIFSSERNYFRNPVEYSLPIGSRPYVVTVGDFNDDHRLDIAVLNFGTNDVTIFQGYHKELFVSIQSYSTGINSIPRSIVIADLNNDHRLDLAIAHDGANTLLIFYGFGNGTFGKDISCPMIHNSRSYSIAVADFDNDGWMDIALANFQANYVEILLQPCLTFI